MKSRRLGGKTRSLTEEISSMMIGPPNTGGGVGGTRRSSEGHGQSAFVVFVVYGMACFLLGMHACTRARARTRWPLAWEGPGALSAPSAPIRSP